MKGDRTREYVLLGNFTLVFLVTISFGINDSFALNYNPIVIIDFPDSGGSSYYYLTEIAVNPTTNTIYVANVGDNTAVLVIDGTTNEVIDTIYLEHAFISEIAVNPTTNNIYVVSSETDRVQVIDGITNEVIDTISSPNITGFAVNPTSNKFYMSSDDISWSFVTFDGTTNEPIALLERFEFGEIAVNPTTNTIYVLDTFDNTIKVIDGTTNLIIDEINVEHSFTEYTIMAVNPTTNTVYLSEFNSRYLSVIDGTTNEVIDTIDVETVPIWEIAVNPTTNTVYVGHAVRSHLTVIDGTTNEVIGIIPVASHDITVNPITNTLYASIGQRGNDVIAVVTFVDEPQLDTGNSGDNQWDTRPTFGASHETRQDQIIDNGFRFNSEYFAVTDNRHTDFAQQSVDIGTVNSFSATVYADKKLKVQEFLFGIPNVGDAHLAELGVEVWYDLDGNIEDVKVVQKSDVIDADSITVKYEKSKCIATDADARCDTTTVSMTFLEPLKDKVMAIKAIDWKNRDRRTYLNEGFDIFGDSLNPMDTKMIPSNVKNQGLVQVTQMAKYSPYWTAEDGRMFEMNSFGSFKEINQSFERFQDTGTAYTRLHSGFGGVMTYEIKRATGVFDASDLIKELPDYIPYSPPEITEKRTEEMKEKMSEQEKIAKELLNARVQPQRNY